MNNIQEITPEEAKQAIVAGAKVIDARTKEEHAEGHIPESINIDVTDPSFTEEASALAKGDAYVVYCRSGDRSARAVSEMNELGFVSAKNMRGGITAWEEKGFEVE